MRFKSTTQFVNYLFESSNSAATKSVNDFFASKTRKTPGGKGITIIDNEVMEKLNSYSEEELIAAGKWIIKSSPETLFFDKGVTDDYPGSGFLTGYIKKLWLNKFGTKKDIPAELRETLQEGFLFRKNRRHREF